MSGPPIPEIDLLGFLHGSKTEKSEAVDKVRYACEQIGFLTLPVHTIPHKLIKQARSTTEVFFSNSAALKEKYRRSAEPGSRGYSGLADIGLAYSLDKDRPPDLHEAFVLGAEVAHEDNEYFTSNYGHQFFMLNVWPEVPKEFRQTMLAYFSEMKILASYILKIFALALDLEENFFADKTDKSISSLRLIHYPAQEDSPMAGQIRAGEHTDYGTLTILHTDQVPAGGLQVSYKDNWHDVVPPENGFVINIGDLMAQWTNDKWISTLHRVVNPPAEVGNFSRYSLVYFQQPNYDVEITCLKSCVTKDSPEKYSPVTSGEHWLSKMKKARQINQ